MPEPWLKTGGALCALVLLAAGCSTSKPAPATADGLRRVVGTALVGARGQSASDQLAIDETAAGLCGAAVWTASECARHGRESRAK